MGHGNVHLIHFAYGMTRSQANASISQQKEVRYYYVGVFKFQFYMLWIKKLKIIKTFALFFLSFSILDLI